MQPRSGCNTSIGSSIVTMCWRRVEGRGLPGAGRSGNEHEPALLLGEASDAGRKVELVEARDLVGNQPERERDRSALPEAVHAEAREARLRARDVEIARLVEDL